MILSNMERNSQKICFKLTKQMFFYFFTHSNHNVSLSEIILLKVFILPRVAELFIHKEKQRGCPLLGSNRYTHIYISYICVYIYYLFV